MRQAQYHSIDTLGIIALPRAKYGVWHMTHSPWVRPVPPQAWDSLYVFRVLEVVPHLEKVGIPKEQAAPKIG